MLALLGANDGTSDGDVVGSMEGLSESNSDAADGANVGASDGGLDGGNVGVRVGGIDGSVLGGSVGSGVGFVGDEVGACVGDSVGGSVGASVGAIELVVTGIGQSLRVHTLRLAGKPSSRPFVWHRLSVSSRRSVRLASSNAAHLWSSTRLTHSALRSCSPTPHVTEQGPQSVDTTQYAPSDGHTCMYVCT